MCSEAIVFFFFKQKTAYELRISDWSSDVCSSDLLLRIRARIGQEILEGIAALFTADRLVERVIATAEALRHRRHIGRRDLECGGDLVARGVVELCRAAGPLQLGPQPAKVDEQPLLARPGARPHDLPPPRPPYLPPHSDPPP